MIVLVYDIEIHCAFKIIQIHCIYLDLCNAGVFRNISQQTLKNTVNIHANLIQNGDQSPFSGVGGLLVDHERFFDQVGVEWDPWKIAAQQNATARWLAEWGRNSGENRCAARRGALGVGCDI